MATISICMIVKNEEQVIGRCLSSVKDLADEIIIVDTGSTDKTKEIAATFTDKIYDFEWIQDFSAARNFSLGKGTMDFLMWLDADDVILPEDLRKFLAYKKTLTGDVGMVMMKYNVGFDEYGNTTLSYYRERLFNREGKYRFEDPIHEAVVPRGLVLYSDIAVTHRKIATSDPARNLKIYQKMIGEGRTLTPRQQFYYARELYYNGAYREAAAELSGFLDSGKGWLENCISACRDLADCYRRLGDEKGELAALLKSFEFDEPRAEICCDVGEYFFRRGKYRAAIFWYQTAAARPVNEQDGGFKLMDCYGYTPYLQLCVCYDRLGDRKTAAYYNNLAGNLKPQGKAYLYNREYFKKLEEES